MEADWDLHAVVRGYTSTSTSTAAAAATATATTDSSSCGQLFGSFQQDFIINFSSTRLQDPFEPKGETSIEELHELYKPFYRKPQEPPQMALSLPYSPLSVLAGLQDPSSAKQHQQTTKQAPQQPQIQQRQQSFPVSKTSASQTRSRKRKNNLKRVYHVPAEKLPSDPWSWRKYGQKPIKGSPYPRGYYRCSTSKGCMARKQVERHRSDPEMFMVTYTAEHNHPKPTHRNSLAGSTRHKPAENPTSEGDPNKLSETSPAASLSSAPGKLDGTREEELAEAENDGEDDDDDFSMSDMPLADDFFAGLEDFTAGEWVWDNFPAGEEFPWQANSAAAGGG